MILFIDIAMHYVFIIFVNSNLLQLIVAIVSSSSFVFIFSYLVRRGKNKHTVDTHRTVQVFCFYVITHMACFIPTRH